MPVGPEFQDPPPKPNALPYFVLPQNSGQQGGPPFPGIAFPVSSISTSPTTFTAVANDDNPNDTLTGRWVANYPPYTADSTHLLSTKPGTRDPAGNLAATFTVDVTCDSFTGGADHDLTFIVSDRGFLSDDMAAELLSPFVYNFDAETPPQVVLTMTSWRIIGCPSP